VETKVEIQLFHSNCGAACLAMLLKPYNVHVAVSDCHKSMIKDSRGFTSILEIVRVAQEFYNIELCVYKSSIENLILLRLPAILHYKNSHFVVLKSMEKSSPSFRIIDPYFGPVSLDYQQLNELFSEVVIVVHDKHDKIKSDMSLQESILYYLYRLAVYPIFFVRKFFFKVSKFVRLSTLKNL